MAAALFPLTTTKIAPWENFELTQAKMTNYSGRRYIEIRAHLFRTRVPQARKQGAVKGAMIGVVVAWALAIAHIFSAIITPLVALMCFAKNLIFYVVTGSLAGAVIGTVVEYYDINTRESVYRVDTDRLNQLTALLAAEPVAKMVRAVLLDGEFINNQAVYEVSCPVGLDIMRDPVSTPCGHSFERSSLVGTDPEGQKGWFTLGNVNCPYCKRTPLTAEDIVDDFRSYLKVQKIMHRLFEFVDAHPERFNYEDYRSPQMCLLREAAKYQMDMIARHTVRSLAEALQQNHITLDEHDRANAGYLAWRMS